MRIITVFTIAGLLVACGDSESSPEPGAPEQPTQGTEVSPGSPVTGSETPLRVPPELLPPTGSPVPPTGSATGPNATPPSGQTPALPSTPSAPVGQPTSESTEILARAERAYSQIRSMEADFTQTVNLPLLQTTRSGSGKLYSRLPDRFAMRFADPRGDVVVADGQYIWMYYPSDDSAQVMRGRLSQGGQQVDFQREFLSNATQRYNATLTGTETVGGRQTQALTLVPRNPSQYRQIRIWVDTQDSLVRRFEITEQNESVRTVELSNLRPNATLADNVFSFTPPAGTQVYDF